MFNIVAMLRQSIKISHYLLSNALENGKKYFENIVEASCWRQICGGAAQNTDRWEGKGERTRCFSKEQQFLRE